jgi:hypothetical protein
MAESWRDNIDVHPAADMFPMMSEAELDELAADIAQHGLRVPIWFSAYGELLDGRNRLAAIDRIPDQKRRDECRNWADYNARGLSYVGDPYKFVVSANVHRRHLTAEQKRDVIAALLKANPERSDRATAKIAKASPTTVGTIRQELEREGMVSKLDTRVGVDGISQPASKPRPDPAAQRAQPHRDGPNFWPTPACLTTALVQYVMPHLPPGPVWECACGDGRLARAIAATGRRVMGSDLYPQDGEIPCDFLTYKPPPSSRDRIVITNPPFNQNDEFLTRGMSLLDEGVIRGLVLLLRHDHLMASSRTTIFNRAVREVHCNWRPIWIPETKGNPRWSFHWLSWFDGPRCAPVYLHQDDVTLEEAAA